MKDQELVVLEVEELEERIAPVGNAMELTNPGGNNPQGNGAHNGQAHEYQNPAGHAPPGQNK